MNLNPMSSALSQALSRLSPKTRAALRTEIEARLAQHRLHFYRPYPKQIAFHAAGATYRERLLRAGNQLGKTMAGAAEMAMHLTGRYPDWWQGRRWDRPVTAWVGSKSSVDQRDSVAKLLMGAPGEQGTGFIPKAAIVSSTASRSIADSYDAVTVRHQSGALSRLTFKTYDQGRERWQGATLDAVWFDEEPDEEIYTEGLTRTNATGGMVWMTFTPLLGMSSVVRRFLVEQSPDRNDTNMVIEDALHIPAAQRAIIIDSYPPHEREARTKGTPILGSGRIFPVAEEAITVPPMPLPPHWVQIGAMDFGWDHPFGAVKLAWDRDADCVYVTNAYRVREATPILHVAALKPWGEPEQWLPWAWPHDGLQHSKDSGEPLSGQYRKHGLRMLSDHAQYVDGSTGVEAGLMEMLDRMQTGRFKVFAHLNEWFEEFRLYHRKDGKVVKEGDDLMSATRYGIMSLRKAVLPSGRREATLQADSSYSYLRSARQ
jgi:phage terminase large subunit-like protein